MKLRPPHQTAVLTTLVSLCCLSMLIAQSPGFEVASVRVHKDGGGTTREIEHGSMRYLNITLGEFINMAYGGKRYQIAGPDWAVSNASRDRYDIVAKAEGASEQQMQKMLGPLLEERFKLQFHREKRELPVYALTVLKGGPKFKEGDGGDSSIGPDPKGGVLYKNVPLNALAGLLSNIPAVGRAVVDRTGMSGKYTFTVNLFDAPAGAPASDIKRDLTGGDSDPVSTPIFSNLQLQLGLKLEPAKEAMEMIVIDHVEKTPTDD